MGPSEGGQDRTGSFGAEHPSSPNSHPCEDPSEKRETQPGAPVVQSSIQSCHHEWWGRTCAPGQPAVSRWRLKRRSLPAAVLNHPFSLPTSTLVWSSVVVFCHFALGGGPRALSYHFTFTFISSCKKRSCFLSDSVYLGLFWTKQASRTSSPALGVKSSLFAL